MPDYSEYFQREFNKRLGNAIGRPIAVPEYKALPYRPKAQQKRVVQRIASGITDLSTNVENNYEDMFGPAAVGGGDTSGRLVQQKIDENTRKSVKRLEKIQQQILETARVDFAAQQMEAAKARGVEFGEGTNPIARFFDRGPKNWLEKGLNALGRPQQAIFGAMMANRDKPGMPESDIDLKDVFSGMWAGLSGKKHWTGGQVAEEYLEGAPHWAKVVGGVGAELGLDPLNVVGAEAIKLGAAGKMLDEASLVENIAEAGGRAVGESGVDVGRRARNLPGVGGMVQPGAAAQATVKNEIADVIRDAIVTTRRGGRRKINLGPKRIVSEVAKERGGQAFRNWRLKRFESFLEAYKNHALGTGPALSARRIQIMKQSDEFFKEFIDQLPAGVKWSDDLANTVRATLDKDVQSLIEKIAENVTKSYKPGLGLRVAGKTVKVPFVGKALDVLSTQASKRFDVDALRQFSHAGQFPGRIALLSQAGHARGMREMDEFEALITDYVRDNKITKAERKEIINQIETQGGFSHDPRLQHAMDFVQTHMKRMYEDEVWHGARDRASTPYVDNYTYVWNRGGRKKRVDDFKDARKEQIRNNGGSSAADYQIKDAAEKGFKPVDDAFDMLLMRQLKSNRDITRANFRNDLINNYGISARGLNKAARTSRGLEEIPLTHVNDHMKSLIKPDMGDKYYLPQAMNDVFTDFKELGKFGTDYTLIRWFKRLTNAIKSSITVYNPGYHIRNMMSDTIMGMLDKVGMKPYYELLRKGNWELTRVGGKRIPRFRPKTGATIKIGNNWTMTMDELWHTFKTHAASGGYTSSEFGANALGRAGAKLRRGVRSASEQREDFGRIAHFLGALRQEFKAAPGGLRNLDATKLKAVEAATARVNHWKFDYSALTRWENRYVKPVVPFYTFARKAIPTLGENFLMNPKWLQRYRKLREAATGEDAENFPSYLIPQWMKDVGYANVTDEKEPWMATFESLPTNAFQSLVPGDRSAAGFAQNLIEQVNPLIQAPFEVAKGREIFSNRKIDNYWEYAMNKAGGPLQAGVKGHELYQGGVEPWQLALTSRLGAGLPFRKITTKQQEYLRNAWEDKYIEAPFDRFNEGPGKDQHVKISTSKGQGALGKSSYKVRDTSTGEVLYQGIDPFAALEVAQKKQGTNLPTSMSEFNNSLEAQTAGIRVYRSERKDGTSYRVRNTKNNKVLRDFKDPAAAYNFAQRRAGG